jgi:hypothetical protein
MLLFWMLAFGFSTIVLVKIHWAFALVLAVGVGVYNGRRNGKDLHEDYGRLGLEIVPAMSGLVSIFTGPANRGAGEKFLWFLGTMLVLYVTILAVHIFTLRFYPQNQEETG